MIGKVWSFQSFETLKALVLFGSKHHDGGFAVFGHRLQFAPRRLNDLAEQILGVLDRPTATSHGLTFWLEFLARISPVRSPSRWLRATRDWVRFAKSAPVLTASALAASEVDTGSATVLVDELDAGILQGTADT